MRLDTRGWRKITDKELLKAVEESFMRIQRQTYEDKLRTLVYKKSERLASKISKLTNKYHLERRKANDIFTKEIQKVNKQISRLNNSKKGGVCVP